MSLTGTIGKRDYGYSAIIRNQEKLLLNQRLCKLSANEICYQHFLYYLIKSSRFLYSFFIIGNGGTGNQANVGINELREIKIPLPPLPEQKKIAEILSTWDKAIETTQALIKKLQLRKKGLMQQFFTGKKRLPGFSGEWEVKPLSHYLEVSNSKNKDLLFDKNDVLSVSGEYGIVNQIKFQGRSFAGASVAPYGIVERGDVVYTKSPLKSNPYGIIKVNKGQAGIVSTLYAIYKCKDTVDGEYIEYYFQLDANTNRYLRPLVQKGSKNDMKINNQKVLIDPVLFPMIDEQNAIVDFFRCTDSEVSQTQKYLEHLQDQKKGLMQQLLTGQKRVKV